MHYTKKHYEYLKLATNSEQIWRPEASEKQETRFRNLPKKTHFFKWRKNVCRKKVVNESILLESTASKLCNSFVTALSHLLNHCSVTFQSWTWSTHVSNSFWAFAVMGLELLLFPRIYFFPHAEGLMSTHGTRWHILSINMLGAACAKVCHAGACAELGGKMHPVVF